MQVIKLFPFHNHLFLQQAMQSKQTAVCCPLCQKDIGDTPDVTTLPNNNSTLHIIKLGEKRKQEEEQKERDKAKVETLGSPR